MIKSIILLRVRPVLIKTTSPLLYEALSMQEEYPCKAVMVRASDLEQQKSQLEQWAVLVMMKPHVYLYAS